MASSTDLRTFFTLIEAGYTSCAHPRLKVNAASLRDEQGYIDALVRCQDCGARGSSAYDLEGGSIFQQRDPVTA